MTESRERSTDEGSGLGNISKSLHVHEKPLKLLICGFVSVEEWGVWPGGRGGSTEMGPGRNNAVAVVNTLHHNQQNDNNKFLPTVSHF